MMIPKTAGRRAGRAAAYVDILLPNEDEVRRIARQASVEDALDALAPQIPSSS